MNLQELNKVVSNVANICEGRVYKKEFLYTDNGSYLFLNNVGDELSTLIEWLKDKGTQIQPILATNRMYEIDDILELETDVFSHFKNNCQVVSGNYLLKVVDGKIVQKKLINKYAL